MTPRDFLFSVMLEKVDSKWPPRPSRVPFSWIDPRRVGLLASVLRRRKTAAANNNCVRSLSLQESCRREF